MKKKFTIFLFLAALAFGLAGTVFGSPEYLNGGGGVAGFNPTYGTTYNCGLCHTTPTASSSARNPFGSDWANASIGNHQFPMTAALAARDSDGDGFSNGAEVSAGTYPGDPNSKPAVVTAPVINSFTATPSSITSGQSSALSWSLSGGAPTTLTIDNGAGSVLGLTSKTVAPSATTTYTLTASNSAGTVTQSVTVTVTPAVTAPLINSFTANPSSITSGQSSALSWSLSGGAPTTLTIDNGAGSVLGLTSKTVAPSATTAYTLTASNSAGTVTQSVTVTVTPAVTAPLINSFTANPSSITSGQSSALSWSLSGGAPTTLTIDNGVGSVLGSASKTVAPSATTAYTLTASNSAGTVTQSVTVTVTPEGSTPDMSAWVGKWFKVTETNTGFSAGNSGGGLMNDHLSIVGYVKLWGWDQTNGVLQGDGYMQDAQTGQWISEPFMLNFIAGSNLDFLCSSEVTGDLTMRFTARMQGKERNGVLGSATFKTLGGYYIEVSRASGSPEYFAGGLSITGKLIPESKVPVPADAQLH